MRLTITLVTIASLASTITCQDLFPVNEQEMQICQENVMYPIKAISREVPLN